MPRKSFEGERARRVIVATGNLSKLRELKQLLRDFPFELIAQSELGIEPVEETGATFAENALLKARHAARISGLAAIADDSGLEVDALNGRPGLFSARFAGLGASDADNNAKLVAELREAARLRDAVQLRDAARPHDAARRGDATVPHTARFHCAIAFVRDGDDALPIVTNGVWEGEVREAPRGARGFGYDPHFWLPSRGCTAAEMEASEKNAISHRGQALRGLRRALAERSP